MVYIHAFSFTVLCAFATISSVANAEDYDDYYDDYYSGFPSCCEEDEQVNEILPGFEGDEVCQYNGDLYFEPQNFLRNYCDCSNDIATPTTSCLGCCLDAHIENRDATCANDFFCLEENTLEFLTCENGCIQTCLDICYLESRVCVDSCSSGGLGGLGTMIGVIMPSNGNDCSSTCAGEFFTCTDGCDEERRKSQDNLILS